MGRCILIRELRLKLGLAQKQLAEAVGVSVQTIYKLEHSQTDEHRAEVEAWLQAEIKKKETHFEHGKSYRICEKAHYSDIFDSLNWSGCCVFVYLGKHGAHHCFREEKAGWSRTYTDFQLIGKITKEHKSPT